jgi:hypothetical protein
MYPLLYKEVGIIVSNSEGPVGTKDGEKEQGIAFGDPKKISVGEVITVPIQYTQTKEGI